MPRKPSKKPPRPLEPEPTKPGPEADRLVIKPELIVPGLDRLLRKKAPPMDKSKRRKPK